MLEFASSWGVTFIVVVVPLHLRKPSGRSCVGQTHFPFLIIISGQDGSDTLAHRMRIRMVLGLERSDHQFLNRLADPALLFSAGGRTPS